MDALLETALDIDLAAAFEVTDLLFPVRARFIAYSQIIHCLAYASHMARSGIARHTVNSFMIWKDVLNPLENPAATLFRHCCQDRRDAVRLRRHGKTNGVVDDHRWLVAVDIRELERLVVNQHNDAIIRREKRFEPDRCKCGHTSVPS
jgi:hypothetical protein